MQTPNLSGASEMIFDAAPPRYLHHYSSCAGILGILNSKSIWASEVRSLNDQKEIGHAVDVTTHAFENYLRQNGIRDEKLVSRATEFLRASEGKVYGHCVCSFSESGDILSQWRAYGSDGQGISIGMSSESLKADAEKKGFTLGKCLYDYQEKYRICFCFVSKTLSRISIDEILAELPVSVPQVFEEFIYTVGLFLKHEAFVDEREWRIVSGKNPLYSQEWKYRATNRGLSSYLELPLESVFSREPSGDTSVGSPRFQFTMGPRTRKQPTAYILQALGYRITGRGYGVAQSGAPYVD